MKTYKERSRQILPTPAGGYRSTKLLLVEY